MVQSYGTQLPDQATSLLSQIDNVLGFYSDVQDFFESRAALEREYAQKLQAITRKLGDKKAKKGDQLWIGQSLGKGGGVGGKCTLNNTLMEVMTATESIASSHIQLADKLSTTVSAELREKARRKGVILSRYDTYYKELVTQRDDYYSGRAKAKSKYESACSDLESARLKNERSQASGDRHADRAAKAFEEAKVAVGEKKNAFLVHTEIANREKEKFYRQDLPAFQDKLQDLHLSSLSTLHALFTTSQTHTAAHHSTLSSLTESTLASLKTVNLESDINLYIEYNVPIGQWKEPDGWGWEPADGFYEEGTMNLEPGPKIILQNRLARSHAKAVQLEPVYIIKSGELNQLVQLVSKYSLEPSLGDPDQVMESMLGNMTEVVTLSNQLTACTTVIMHLEETLGDDQGTAQPHDFKPTGFTIPASCAHCGSSIWGLSKQGKTCNGCGITVHAKCELKVPSDCSVAGASRRLSTTGLTRSSSSASSMMSKAPSTTTTGSHPPALEEEYEESEDHHGVANGRKARVAFDYQATSEFELTVVEGETCTILEEDDGSGWVKVDDGRGGRGLIPATYIEDLPEPARAAAAAAPAVPTSRPRMTPPPVSLVQFVTALYDYDSTGPDELSLVSGQRFELTDVGFDYGEGWAEGRQDGRVGVFPSNYVERS